MVCVEIIQVPGGTEIIFAVLGADVMPGVHFPFCFGPLTFLTLFRSAAAGNNFRAEVNY